MGMNYLLNKVKRCNDSVCVDRFCIPSLERRLPDAEKIKWDIARWRAIMVGVITDRDVLEAFLNRQYGEGGIRVRFITENEVLLK